MKAIIRSRWTRDRLDQLLDTVKPNKNEATLDVRSYTEEQKKEIIRRAESRGLHVSGTKNHLLIRDLSEMEK